MSELDQLRALSRGLSCAIGRLGWDGLETEDLRAVLQEHGVPFLTPEEIAKDETLLPPRISLHADLELAFGAARKARACSNPPISEEELQKWNVAADEAITKVLKDAGVPQPNNDRVYQVEDHD